jgi:hypothetical protein
MCRLEEIEIVISGEGAQRNHKTIQCSSAA